MVITYYPCDYIEIYAYWTDKKTMEIIMIKIEGAGSELSKNWNG